MGVKYWCLFLITLCGMCLESMDVKPAKVYFFTEAQYFDYSNNSQYAFKIGSDVIPISAQIKEKCTTLSSLPSNNNFFKWRLEAWGGRKPIDLGFSTSPNLLKSFLTLVGASYPEKDSCPTESKSEIIEKFNISMDMGEEACSFLKLAYSLNVPYFINGYEQALAEAIENCPATQKRYEMIAKIEASLGHFSANVINKLPIYSYMYKMLGETKDISSLKYLPHVDGGWWIVLLPGQPAKEVYNQFQQDKVKLRDAAAFIYYCKEGATFDWNEFPSTLQKIKQMSLNAQALLRVKLPC